MDAAEWNQWIDGLIATGTPESTTLDFKLKPPELKESKAQREFLLDIAAFANAQGGRIVYGIKEDNAFASQIVEFPDNPDKLAQQMLALSAAWLQPRVTGIQFVPIQRRNGYLLVADIPQQFTGPFLARMSDDQWFKIRNGLTKTNMTYEQIRSAFGARAQAADNLRAWRRTRLDELSQHIQGRRLAKVPWAVLHVMPIAAFATPTAMDLTSASPIHSSYPRSRYNLDGRLFLSSRETSARRFQIFRNGVVETCWATAGQFDGTRTGTILSITAAQETWTGLRNARAVFAHWGIAGPVAISLALLNAGNTELSFMIDVSQRSQYALEDDSAIFPEELVDTVESLESEPGKATKLLMDTLWQVYGEEECAYIGTNGDWRIAREEPTMR